jgi:hypothetical protein
MEGKAGNVTKGPADLLPVAAPVDLAANSTGRVLDQGERMTPRYGQDRFQVAGHAHLVHAQDGFCALCSCAVNLRWVHVERPGAYVHKDGISSTVADAVGSGDEGVADGDHLISRTNPSRAKREVQGCGAA